MNRQSKPLYRKVNTTARGVQHNDGGDFSTNRNSNKKEEYAKTSMSSKQHRGLDYTPLYRFLLSKVGSTWNEVYSSAVKRLNTSDPIYNMVAKNEETKTECVRIGESSYYSGLYVDDAGILQKVNPLFGPHDIMVSCSCCTWTFNGNIISHK